MKVPVGVRIGTGSALVWLVIYGASTALLGHPASWVVLAATTMFVGIAMSVVFTAMHAVMGTGWGADRPSDRAAGFTEVVDAPFSSVVERAQVLFSGARSSRASDGTVTLQTGLGLWSFGERITIRDDGGATTIESRSWPSIGVDLGVNRDNVRRLLVAVGAPATPPEPAREVVTPARVAARTRVPER